MLRGVQIETRIFSRRFIVILLIGLSAGFNIGYIFLASLEHNCEEGRQTYSDKQVYKKENCNVADELAKKIRVLCWVMTQPSNHDTKAIHVKATWGNDKTLPSVKLPVNEGREFLWAKTKESFRYVYEHHRDDADWFLKADDDTYVIVENLRYMLADFDPNDATYFGCRFKPFTPQGYMSGGAGYVLSRAALDKFVTEALPAPYLCQASNQGTEDKEIGQCLEKINVKAMDSRDSLKRGRFFPFEPRGHLFPNKDKNFWYWQYQFYPTDEGLDCCSNYAISFHYVPPEQMYVMDYLIYRLRPYGIKFDDSEDLPKLLKGNGSKEVTNN